MLTSHNVGIYLALDVNSPHYSLNRADPGPSYNPTYLQSIFATIDAFAGYSNTLLFFSGNEVINAANSTSAAPYVKAWRAGAHGTAIRVANSYLLRSSIRTLWNQIVAWATGYSGFVGMATAM